MQLTSLEIDGFRGLRDFKAQIPRLVTLVAGKNNAGKSTLLEAIEMLAGASNPRSFLTVNGQRELTCHSLDDMTSFFYGRDVRNRIHLAGAFREGIVRHVALSSQMPQSGELSVDVANSGMPREFIYSYFDGTEGRDPQPGLVRFAEGGADQLKWEVLKETEVKNWKCAVCTSGNEPKTCDIVSQLKNACSEAWLVEFLKKMDANIQDITVDKSNILLGIDNLNNRLPLQLMGDGINKVVKVLGLMCSVGEGGIVCVDEVDNGLHYSAMRSFVDQVVRLAVERKVQVLMTTHSLELMRFFSSGVSEREEDFGFLRMVRYGDGQTVAFPYDARSFAASLKGGVELR